MPEAFQISNAPDPAITRFKVRVLLVDDQLIIAEAVRRMLDGQPDIEFHYVSNAAAAVETALQLQPTFEQTQKLV